MIRTTTPTLELTFLGNDLEQGHATSQTVSSAHIVNRSIQFSQTLIKDLKSSSDQVRLQLHKNCPSTEDIIATEGDIKAVLKDDGTPVFTGYLSTNFSWSVTANGEQALSITLEGVGTRLLNKVYSTASGFFSGTASSAVSSICQACGITVASEYANILTESVSSVIEAGSTCRSLLDQLCYECNAVYFFNEVGQLCISRINPSTFGADTIDSEELYVVNGNAVSVSKTLRQYSNARVIYTELETADNYLVYRNTTGQDATHPYCKLDLPGGNYFDGTEIYTAQQWSEAQADAFREPAVIGAVNAASESEKVGSGEILAISNLRGESTSVGSFSVNFTAKGGADFSMEVHNTSSVAGYLTRLDLYASIVYAKSTSVIRASATGDYSSKMIDEELVWIHDKSLAQAHANLLCQYHRSAGAKYSFYASRDLELGKVYRLNENAFSGLDVYVLIIGKSFGDTSEIASYSAVGVTSFNLTKDVYYKTEMDGVSAPAQGKPGAPGTTFTPSVSEDGVISWTNDGGQENPPAVSIKGPAGNASKYWGVLNTPPMGAAEGDFFVFGLCGETYETTDEGKIFVFKNQDWEDLPLTPENNEKILVAYSDILAKKDDTAYFSKPPTASGAIQYAKVLLANVIIADAIKATDGFFDNITATNASILGNIFHSKFRTVDTLDLGSITGAITWEKPEGYYETAGSNIVSVFGTESFFRAVPMSGDITYFNYGLPDSVKTVSVAVTSSSSPIWYFDYNYNLDEDTLSLRIDRGKATFIYLTGRISGTVKAMKLSLVDGNVPIVFNVDFTPVEAHAETSALLPMNIAQGGIVSPSDRIGDAQHLFAGVYSSMMFCDSLKYINDVTGQVKSIMQNGEVWGAVFN